MNEIMAIWLAVIYKQLKKMDKLIFATNNSHKLHEVKQLLKNQFDVIGMEEAGFTDDIPENEPTLEGNARAKARYIYEKLKVNVFADDTGLEIDVLNGEPGVYSARYAGPAKSSEANMLLVLNKLQHQENRKARFRTAICLIYQDKEYLFEGIVTGQILHTKKGDAGFGYDPIFQPDEYNLSFAEMPLDEKNKISHRGRAIQKLVAFLSSKQV